MNSTIKHKYYINSVKKYIDNINILLHELKYNPIKIDPEKEKKHRIINYYNKPDNYNIIKEINNIQFKTKENNINSMDIIYNNKTKAQKRIRQEKITVDEVKPRGVSLFPIDSASEITRLLNAYDLELQLFYDILKSNINQDYLFDVIDSYNIQHRIKVLDSTFEIINNKIFSNDSAKDYIKCIIFSPPINELSLYSLLFENNTSYLCNCYILVCNRNNERHFFYGNFDFIKGHQDFENVFKQYNKETSLNNLMAIFYKSFELNPATFLFKSAELTINNEITFKNIMQTDLYKSYIHFLKLYLNNYLPHNKFKIYGVYKTTSTSELITTTLIQILVNEIKIIINNKEITDIKTKIGLINSSRYFFTKNNTKSTQLYLSCELNNDEITNYINVEIYDDFEHDHIIKLINKMYVDGKCEITMSATNE